MSYPKDDHDWTEHVVTKVGDSHFETGLVGLGFKADAPGQPRVGAVCRMYGRGLGYPVRGVFFDGVENFYRTPAQSREHFKRMGVARDLERQRRWAEKGKAEFDAAYAALPGVFQKRLDRFAYNLEGFGWQNGAYEMSCCVDGVRIAKALKTPEAIAAFARLPWAEQEKAIPDLFGGHSGNTFGMAVRLAHHYVTDPDLVWKEHAAMAALLGCQDAGCPPVTA